MKIESKWEGLTNPELDPEQVEGGEEGVRGHASTRMKEREGVEAWSVVRVEGRDWGRVLGVGRLGGRVIACEWSSPHRPRIRIADSFMHRFLSRARPDPLRLSLRRRHRVCLDCTFNFAHSLHGISTVFVNPLLTIVST